MTREVRRESRGGLFKARSWDDLCGCILIAVVVLSFAARLIVV